MGHTVYADHNALHSFTRDVFLNLDLPSQQAEDAASVLVWASLRGVDTHGIRNLGQLYVRMIDEGRINTAASFAVDHQTPFSARLDGDQGIGMAAGVWAMRVAIEKAAAAGSGMVAMHNSKHYGAAGYYPWLALEHDMIGLSMTGRFMPCGTDIGLVPTFAAAPMFSTNPLAVAVPTLHEPPFLLDMATTIAPYNRVMLHMERGQPVPQGWGMDDDGAPTTDPARMNQLLPLGGTRELGGHKGYGLAMLVEILACVLSGAWATGLDGSEPSYSGYSQQQDGHFFAALRVDAFQPAAGFKAAMDAMIRALHDAPKAPGHERVYVAGEIEHETEIERRKNGVPLPPNVQADLDVLAGRFGLNRPF